jgi:DNA-binding transcriptional regulator YdaS (Cro superfamily)
MNEQINDAQIDSIKRAIQIVGSQGAMAERLNLKSQGTISQWVTKRRPLPAKHCLKIEAMTEGVITRYELRPDVFGTTNIAA